MDDLLGDVELPADLTEVLPMTQFKAGIIRVAGGVATPDNRKGLVRVIDCEEKIEFQWLLRPDEIAQPDYDLFLDPAEGIWEKVPNAQRVYALKLRSGGPTRLFWMQEPDAALDEAIAIRMNELLRGNAGEADDGGWINSLPSGAPSAAGSSNAPSSSGANAAAAPTGAGAGAGVGAAGNNSQANAAAQLLQQLLALQQQQQQQMASGVSLGSILEAERVIPLIDDDQAALEYLAQFLPEGQRSPAMLRQQLRSPQLQQTVQRMSQVLNGGQYGHVMASLGLQPNATDFGVLGFLAAIQQSADKEQSAQGNQQQQQPSSSNSNNNNNNGGGQGQGNLGRKRDREES